MKLVSRIPKMLCNDCLKIYFRYDVDMHNGTKCCDFCRKFNVCGCGGCLDSARGQMDLDMKITCPGGHIRAVR